MMASVDESASSGRATAVSDRDLVLGSGLFDPQWYLAKYPDVAAAGVEPLGHFLRCGGFEGRHPGPDFDSQFYLLAHPDVRTDRFNPLLHFLQEGREKGWEIRPHESAEAKLVAESGLFDPDWYVARYPDLAGLPVDPLTHFMWHGCREGRDPGPLFDTQYYLDAYPDVAVVGMAPLLHYLTHGRKEGRTIRAPLSVSSPARPVLPLLFEELHAPRIACVVHAYYGDVFEEIAPLLRNVPKNFTLLLAAPSEEAKERAAKVLADQRIHARILLRVVPNRGRNFGSFLSEFSAEVLKHDLVLHVHTKKSLYSGGEQRGWRTSLLRGLIGSRELVQLVLGAFIRNPKLGLLYPAAYRGMPYWAYHWLGNGAAAGSLLRRIGVPAATTSGYLDYPVGGMFWARVDALRPLFEAKLSYGDFPEEAGQTDRTLAHVIERAIAAISAARGYRFAEFDYDDCILRDNWSTRHLDQYIVHSRSEVDGLIANRDLVSFDIFDTLLCRPALEPDSVLRYVGLQLERRDPSFAGFFAARKRAEDVARSKKGYERDVTLAEIFAALRDVAPWSQEQIETAERAEREADLSILRAREGMPEFIKRTAAAGKRVIAISDSYYPTEHLSRALDAAGYAGLIDCIYVSCVEQARKDRGDLWEKVKVAESAKPERWLHVGDNEHSDVQAACDRGIGFFHVMRPTVLFQLMEGAGARAASSREARWATDLLLGPAMLRIASHPRMERDSLAPADLRTARDVGYVVFGPLLFHFLGWLVSHPTVRQLPHVYFLSREGHLLQKLYEMTRARLTDFQLPPSTYLYASRRALLSASQAIEFDPHAILGGPSFEGSFAALLKNRIGFDVPKHLGLADWQVELPRDRAFAEEALSQLREQIVAHARSEIEDLRDYYRRAGLTGSYPGIVVDIGYSATIQRAMQLVLGVQLVGLYCATSRSARMTEEQGGYAYGCFAEDYVSTLEHGTLVRHSLLLESFLTATHAQVTRFARKGDEVAPVFKDQILPDDVLRTLDELQDGAAAYCQELLDLYGCDLLFARSDRNGAETFLTMLVDGKLSIPADVMNALRIEDDFCGYGVVEIGRRTLPGGTGEGNPRAVERGHDIVRTERGRGL